MPWGSSDASWAAQWRSPHDPYRILFEVVDGRSQLFPVPFRPVVAWRQVRYSGTAPCGHDVDRERFGAVVLAQHQEPGCQSDRGQLASARSVLGPGRHRLRCHVAHDLPRAVRGQPYQSAGLADIGLALPRRTLACQAPRVPAGSAGARGHPQALVRHLFRRGSALSPFSRPSHFSARYETTGRYLCIPIQYCNSSARHRCRTGHCARLAARRIEDRTASAVVAVPAAVVVRRPSRLAHALREADVPAGARQGAGVLRDPPAVEQTLAVVRHLGVGVVEYGADLRR